MAKLGIIGYGNMASAIVAGAVKNNFIEYNEIFVNDIDEDKLAKAEELGMSATKFCEEIPENAKYVLLAVKPQNIAGLLYDIKDSVTADTVIISIVAGINDKTICAHLGKKVKVVTVMPNTPIMVGEGTTAVCKNDAVEDEEFTFAKDMFSGASLVKEIPADRMNEIIAVHGSTPAYIYLISKYFCQYASEHGIPYETANEMFAKTLVGAAAMMTNTGLSHDELIDMVCSPNGTTIQGIEALQSWALQGAIFDCCEQTIKRAYQLGEEHATM